LTLLNLYSLPFVISAVVIVVFGLYLFRVNFLGGSKAILGFFFLLAAWAVADTVDIISTDLPLKVILSEIRFILISWIVMVLLIQVTRVVGQGPKITPRKQLILASVPTTVLAITNPWTGLMFQGAHVEFNGLFYITAYQPGPWLFVYLAFAFGAPIFYLSFLSLSLLRNKDSALYKRRQLWMPLLALSLPPVVAGIYMLLYDPYGFFVPISVVSCFSTIMFTFFYNRHGILDLAPIARSGLVDMVSDLMLVLDNDFRIVDVNQKMRALMFGSISVPKDRSIESVLGIRWPALLLAIKEGQKKGEVALEIEGISKTFDYSIELLTRDHIGIVGRMVLLRDVTEKKQNEAALAESEKRFRNLMEMAPFPVLVLDPSGDRILYANSYLYSVLKLQKGDQPSDSIFADLENHRNLITDLSSTGEINDRQIRLRRSDGFVFWAIGSASIVQFEGQSAILSTFNDISPLVLAKEELAQSNQKLKLISSITQHDLTNKLQITSGYIELMKKDSGNGVEYLNKIERSTKEAQNLINFTREYQNLPANSPGWQHIENAFQNASSQLDTGKIELDVRTGDLTVFSDDLFMKVFYNLIDNTLRYGEHVSKISLEYHANENGLSLRYSDDGVGIIAENKENVFDRGFGKNTGLGLSFCREIMKMNEMSIVECGEPGKGVIFEIRVPKERFLVRSDEHSL
jgi:PAS domain S-box-containing protein